MSVWCQIIAGITLVSDTAEDVHSELKRVCVSAEAVQELEVGVLIVGGHKSIVLECTTENYSHPCVCVCVWIHVFTLFLHLKQFIVILLANQC